jgi:hypothetical protein
MTGAAGARVETRFLNDAFVGLTETPGNTVSLSMTLPPVTASADLAVEGLIVITFVKVSPNGISTPPAASWAILKVILPLPPLLMEQGTCTVTGNVQVWSGATTTPSGIGTCDGEMVRPSGDEACRTTPSVEDHPVLPVFFTVTPVS